MKEPGVAQGQGLTRAAFLVILRPKTLVLKVTTKKEAHVEIDQLNIFYNFILFSVFSLVLFYSYFVTLVVSLGLMHIPFHSTFK